jgi:hypothetical protein
MLQFTCKWPGRDPPAAGRRWNIAGQWLPPLPGTSYPVRRAGSHGGPPAFYDGAGLSQCLLCPVAGHVGGGDIPCVERADQHAGRDVGVCRVRQFPAADAVWRGSSGGQRGRGCSAALTRRAWARPAASRRPRRPGWPCCGTGGARQALSCARRLLPTRGTSRRSRPRGAVARLLPGSPGPARGFSAAPQGGRRQVSLHILRR